MANFYPGETVICSVTITNSATGALTNPATSMTITITDPTTVKVVDAQAMINDSTGKYHYDYTSASNAALGTYVVTYTATDGSRVSKQSDQFSIVR